MGLPDRWDAAGAGLGLARSPVVHRSDQRARWITRRARREWLAEVAVLIGESIGTTRSITFELTSPILYDLGLCAALRALAVDLQRSHGLEIDVRCEAAHIAGLTDEVAALMHRSVRELLINVVKHAGIRRATVCLEALGDAIRIEVSDRGHGFVSSSSQPFPGGGGFGLFAVREQVRQLGGSFDLRSEHGRGTSVAMSIPLAPASRA